MKENSDIYVLFLVIAVIVIWLFMSFKRWLYAPRKLNLPHLSSENIVSGGPVVKLLESSGYKVLYGKYKIPLQINVDGKTMHSRYYIDYIVEYNKELFFVKLAKARESIRWSGSSIRDQFMPYFLLYEEISGVIYVNPETNTIKKMIFTLDEEDRRSS